ncbi:MAG: hypothetical protein IKP31_03640 [Lachnospiraceae bacterium]|nr:hypothetical protein [Lachnospiraceae bacterium]
MSSKEVKDNVAEAMISYADDIRDKYISEDISYDDVIKEYDVLKEKVLADDKQLNSDMEEIEKYAESRRLYNMAATQFENKDYLDAIDNYSKVIEEDSLYYDKAKKGIESCDEGITDMLIGRWSFDYNIRDMLEEELKDMAGDIDISKLKLDFTYILEFGDDGEISMDIDRTGLDEYVDGIIDITVNSVKNQVYAEGVSDEEFRQYLTEEYGIDDFETIVRREINSDEIYKEIISELKEFSGGGFKVENGILQMGDSDDMKYEFDGSDTLILGSENDKKTLEEAGFPYPFVLKRYNR